MTSELNTDKSRTIVSNQSLRALDCLNIMIGDVLGGLGPYLAAYLRTAQQWDQASIGAALSAMGIATILSQTPAGALVDRLKQKRILLCGAAGVMSLTCVVITVFSQFYAVMTAQIIYGIGAAVAGPCIVAISLGLVGHKRFASRIARNEAYNHVGNVAAAVLVGLAGFLISPICVFYLIALFSVGSIVATSYIREDEIDHDVASGAVESTSSKPEINIAALLSNKHIAAFGIAVFLFHLSNAAMLPLAGQYLSEGRPREAPLWISACVVSAQFVMVPVSLWAGRAAQTWGRKPVFLIGFSVLPIRGFLYTLNSSPFWVVPVQLLDGIGAGIFGVLASVIVADLTKGTRHYNVTRGAIITAQGFGAVLSNLLAGFLVARFGYVSGFLFLALTGLAGLVICCLGLPETRNLEPELGSFKDG